MGDPMPAVHPFIGRVTICGDSDAMGRDWTILDYHEATKHHFHRYARSAGYMDWQNQPQPFRFFEGAKMVRLPLPDDIPDLPYADLYAAVPAAHRALNLHTLGDFFYHSLAISAWKSAGGSRWALRVHPSSGNLHPTECYLIAPAVDGLAGGVYHYNALGHALARRIDLPAEICSAWRDHFSGDGFGLALSTIFWRESWKYGERAFRYCLLDAGHAAAAIAIAARLNGWQAHCLSGAGDRQIAEILGFDRTVWHSLESEWPEMIFWISAVPQASAIPRTLPEHLVRPLATLPVSGRPEPLSRKPNPWPIIPRAAAATEKEPTSALVFDPMPQSDSCPGSGSRRASDVIRNRRSAVSYDPDKHIAADTFFAILERTLPRAARSPFEAGLPGPAVHLLLFVHRVEDISPGLYFLARSASPDTVSQWRPRCRPGFSWQPVRPDFPLFLLQSADMSYDAMAVSCHQEIAGHGAFAVAMVAPLTATVAERPFMYRHLHWECGMIGQMLYLEAEAHGIRGTGIGCFFDDAVADLMGITDGSLNSLYHFTIGHPVEDRRITTLPAYHHLHAT